jgi:hypothetical protein
MKKLMLATALMLAALASAHAQNIPPGQSPSATPNNNRDALTIKDPIHRDEALIAGANRRGNSLQKSDTINIPNSPYVHTFNARIEVTNNSTKAIKSVSWSASLIDPGTGQLIRAYDVTTNARIAPGKKKHLSKRLPTPRANVVSANSPSISKVPVADLKTKVTLNRNLQDSYTHAAFNFRVAAKSLMA